MTEGSDLRTGPAEKVFDDRLRLAAAHRFDDDIARSVSPDVVVLQRPGIFRGGDGVRDLAHRLAEEVGHVYESPDGWPVRPSARAPRRSRRSRRATHRVGVEGDRLEAEGVVGGRVHEGQNMQAFWRQQDVLDYDTDLPTERIVDQGIMDLALQTFVA